MDNSLEHVIAFGDIVLLSTDDAGIEGFLSCEGCVNKRVRVCSARVGGMLDGDYRYVSSNATK